MPEKGVEVFCLIGRESSPGAHFATNRERAADAVLAEMEYEPDGDENPMTDEEKKDITRQLAAAKVGDNLRFTRGKGQYGSGDTITVRLEEHEAGWLDTLEEFRGW